MALSTTIVSGVTMPETIASPRPGAALISSWSDRPLTGCRVKTIGRGPGRDERLDDDRHRIAIEGQPAARPVADGTLAPERGPAAQDGGRDLVGRQPQFGVMQPGEAGRRPVLGHAG